VEDGVLICQKGAKNLRTEKEYSDFIFRFQFKLTESGNNGLGIRVPADGHAASDGMELQILDHRGTRYNSESKDGKKMTWLKPWQVHGSIYGIYPARTGYLRPLDEWNEQVVVCIEDHIMVILNGAVIVDAFLEDITAVDGRLPVTTTTSSSRTSRSPSSSRVPPCPRWRMTTLRPPVSYLSSTGKISPDGKASPTRTPTSVALSPVTPSSRRSLPPTK
jgi:hypothetical protein